jgi:hypothetical protein
VTARFRNGQAIQVNGIVRTIGNADTAGHSGCNRRIKVIAGCGERNHSPRRS